MDDQVAPLPLQVWRLLVSISTTEATRHVAHGKSRKSSVGNIP
jgi:hypothetical protein